jgi:hypothetical protein
MRFFLKTLPILLIALIAVYLWIFTHYQIQNSKQFGNQHRIIVEKIENIGKLEVLRVNIKDIFEFEQTNKILGFKTSSKALLLVCGEVGICVDFSKVNSNKIMVQNKTLHITLPKPELCYFKVDHSNSKILRIEKTIFITEEARLVDEAYKEAERMLESKIFEQEYLERAKQNVQKILIPLFENISGMKVLITFEDYLKDK